MKYALLIYSDEALEPKPSEPTFMPHMQGYMAFGADLDEKKIEHSGEALKPVSTSTTVRMRNGDASLSDGPFAETKEQLGGFYIVDVPDLDAALECAKKIPSAAFGCVEVRPVETFEGLL